MGGRRKKSKGREVQRGNSASDGGQMDRHICHSPHVGSKEVASSHGEGWGEKKEGAGGTGGTSRPPCKSWIISRERSQIIAHCLS